MKNSVKQYGSLVGILLLILVIGYVGYRSFVAYWGGHSYYSSITNTFQNWGIVLAAILCACVGPILYLIMCSKINLKKLIMWLGIGAGVFGLIHSIIKLYGTGTSVMGFGNVIIIFNTILLFLLGIYLICGFAALGSRIERKIIKFEQLRRQELLLTFGMGLCGFLVIIQILLGIGVLYGIVSWILFLGLGFMVRYERKNLKKWEDIIVGILENFRTGIVHANFGYIILLVLVILSLGYVYMGIQNAFTPYSTAWDANHEYMYTPKILAENGGIYWGNSVGNNMPGIWHQFLTFIFSLTGCTNGWFGLSSDNIAISMNNISASFVLIFGIAIIFQLFTLCNWKKKENLDDKKLNANKGNKNIIIDENLDNGHGIVMGWTTLLLWLTGGMGAFLVIVDNKTDLGVMAISLLALLSGLIFLQNRETSTNKKEILKYVIIAGLLFGFSALAKITAFVDFALFGLLLVGLWFSPLTSLGLGVIVMGLVRKFNILTSSLMLTDMNATRLIIIGFIITATGLILSLSRREKRKSIGISFYHIITLGICFIVPFLLFKLPWVIISQIKTNTYSVSNSFKYVFLTYDSTSKEVDRYKLLAQNTLSDEINASNIESDTDLTDSVTDQDITDTSILTTSLQQTFSQCATAGNIYSEDELNENLQEVVGNGANEDLGRYIGYGWKQFTKEKNGFFWLLKTIWPTKSECYGLNKDARILCNNSGVIESFKIDDLRAIYENGIKNQESEAGVLLKNAIDAYDEAKKSGKLGFINSNNSSLFYDEIVSLRQYYQSHSILSDDESVYIPYRYLVPLNISFNWSLQNLSSYYTDIGFVWIIMYILLIIALPYAIIKKDKLLTAISLTTLIGWGIRWIIGSAILWYGTVLISWTMITLALLWEDLFKKDKNMENPKILPRILVFIVFSLFFIQTLLNYARIASQGASSVFVWYKSNIGKEQFISDDLQTSEKIKHGYGWKSIFDLQFPQYNPIINALADRKDEDGVIVAGTYVQYFLGNQWNVKSDGMLSDFRIKTSDGDLCKTYRRLKNDNTRYLIIDPNIGTVTMGEGNETLFYRFFGKLNSSKTEIELDGTIITLVRLARAGYLKLLSTNNLGSKYAFIVDDDMIRQYFGGDLTDEELILTRAKMAVLQYFSDADSIFQSIGNMFMTRIVYDTEGGLEDIANIYGIEIDSQKLAIAARNYINSGKVDVKSLTQNERAVLINYLNIYLAYQNGDTDSARSMIQNILISSVSGGSQVIAFELN